MTDRPELIISDTGIPVYITASDIDLASYRIFVKTGSKYENIQGIAHVMEHMGFKGTFTRSKDDIMHTIDSFGGNINASTGHDWIVYECDGHARGRDEIFDTMADAVCNPLLDEKELDMEKKVIVQEIAMVKNRPSSYFLHRMLSHVWRGSPDEHPIIGTPETVMGTSREDLKAFHDSQYLRENITVIAGGNIDAKDLIKKVDSTLGVLPSGGRNKDPVLPMNGRSYLHIDGSKESSFLALGFPAKLDVYGLTAMDMLSDILTSGLSSRLYKELRDKRGLIYALMPSLVPLGGGTVFSPGFMATGENLREGLDAMVSCLRDVLDNGVTQEELDIVRMKSLVRLMEGYDSTVERVNLMENQYRIYEDVYDLKHQTDLMDSVTVESISEIAAKVMDPKNLHLTVYGHEEDSMKGFSVDQLEF